MYTILGLIALAAAIAVVYKLLNHKDATPDPLETAEQEAKATVAAVEEKVAVKEKPSCGCGRSPTGYCVGLHKLSDAEWAISDKNPNRVEVAPVVVTADSPATTVAETTEAPVAKKPRATKAKAVAEPAETPKKPRAKKAK